MIGSLWYWVALLVGTLLVAFAGRGRDALLLGLSTALVATWDVRAVVVLAFWSGCIHLAGPHLGPERPHNRAVTWALVGGLVASIAGFKYLAPLAGDTWALAPLGLSYFTFKLIHVVLEMSRGGFGPPTPLRFAQYLLLFPGFVAGPIERWNNFDAGRVERLGRDDVAVGLTRIVHGLIKKFVISEAIGTRLMALVSAQSVATNEQLPPTWRLWGHVLGILVYVYCDFAGYSDLAIGGARLLGYRLRENFESPLLAMNMADWWRRWHISLSSFCMDYVYMPMLGLTRRPILAGYSSMFVMAMWHHVSWNWVVWGLFHGTCLAVFQRHQIRKRKLKKKTPPPTLPVRLALRAAMVALVVSAYSFTASDAFGLYAGVRFFLGLFGVPLPPA